MEGGNEIESRKISSQWILLSWFSFIVAIGTFGIGIYNLDAPLSVQGFYVQSLILIVITSFNLQKTLMEKIEEDAKELERMKLTPPKRLKKDDE